MKRFHREAVSKRRSDKLPACRPIFEVRGIRRSGADAGSVGHEPAGFTLLELLLTSILSTVLLAGLWTLFHTYMRLFETGQAKTEQSQLVRALAQQLSDDLRTVVVAPRAESSGLREAPASAASISTGSPTAGSALTQPSGAGSFANGNGKGVTGGTSQATATLPRFALVGTSHVLKLEFAQTAPPDTRSPEKTPLVGSLRADIVPAVPELRTILYSFEESREVRATDRKAPPGLVRVDLDWRTFFERSTGSRRGGPSGAASGAQAALGDSVDTLGLTSSEALQSLPENSWIHIPEVIHCGFRYFDGRDWTEEWDSRQRQSLPAAVEVTMQLSPPVERWKTRRSENDKHDARSDVSRATAETDPAILESHRPVFRQVIALNTPRNPAQGTAEIGGGESRPPGTEFGGAGPGRNP